MGTILSTCLLLLAILVASCSKDTGEASSESTTSELAPSEGASGGEAKEATAAPEASDENEATGSMDADDDFDSEGSEDGSDEGDEEEEESGDDEEDDWSE